ncbi:MAG: SDR family oxidoreductase [Myxococcales bacterium]|nr:SDR family oxidoreductase [Myxococcales bacterium]
MQIEDKAVLITGASRGLGRALALGLGRAGARIAAVARHADELEEVVAAIRAAGGDAHAIVADVADKNAIYPLAGTAQALVGPIDILIHNASTLGVTPLRHLLDTECEDFQHVLDVNLLGPFRLTKAIAGGMAARGDGLVVSLSSDAAVAAYAGWGAYSVSKAALDHLSRVFAVELSPFGVRFLSIDPGEMNTLMHAAALPEADPATLASPEAVAARIIALLSGKTPWADGARFDAAALEAA